MKPTTVLALSWILLASDAVVHAQEFQNLDFEQAMPELPGYPGDDRYRYAANVLPHWLVDASGGDGAGTYPVAYNTYGHIGLDPPLIYVFGGDGMSTDDPAIPDSYRAVAGNYSATLFPVGYTAWTSLRQTGLIPAGARSLRFSGKVDDEPFPPAGLFPYVEVSLNGVALPIYELGPVVGETYRFGTDQQVFQYSVNVPPALAGTTAALQFYAAGGNARLTLDDIHFSPVGIPEPSSLGLAATSALALVAAGRRAKKPCA